MGVQRVETLQQMPPELLVQAFGKSGLHFFNIVRGIHLSEVQPNRKRKSLSAENTFEKDLSKESEWQEELVKIFEELKRRIERTGIKGRTITLKIKYGDFTIQTRSKSYEQYPEMEVIWETAMELLHQEELKGAVRLFGLGLSNLNLTEEKILFGKQLWLDFESSSE
jgi:DNA polymerase-4